LGCHIFPTTAPSTYSSDLIQTKYHLVHTASSQDFQSRHSLNTSVDWFSLLVVRVKLFRAFLAASSSIDIHGTNYFHHILSVRSLFGAQALQAVSI
jgi:hypothetical protein